MQAVLPNENNNSLHVVAPGENKVPISFCKDWDAKAFPMLLPDGNNNLFGTRKNKLSDQEYIKQWLYNLDGRWRGNPHWVFAAATYRERKDFNRNIDMAYTKGKKTSDKDENIVYTLDDPYKVFQNICITPSYHLKGRYKMYARIDN